MVDEPLPLLSRQTESTLNPASDLALVLEIVVDMVAPASASQWDS